MAGVPYATSWREIPYTRYLGKFGLVLCVLFVLGIKFDLDSKLNINWDEFNYLSKIFQNHRNELGLRLQTLHIHIF
ncbi:MAG: hypothetical protein HRU14_16860, partial [Planctomycetes bacterium]|nr:hypothetical protein [Planctomycetota bacterium]